MNFDKLKLDLSKLPEVNVYIEIPEESRVKYEIDEETGFLTADRFLYTAMSFPFSYGFIPNSRGEDGDPLDVLVLASESLVPGVVVKSKIIGLLEMEDEAGIDTKFIAVPIAKVDPICGVYEDITDVPTITKDKIKHFFDHYKELEPNKWVKTGEFLGKDKAISSIVKLSK